MDSADDEWGAPTGEPTVSFFSALGNAARFTSLMDIEEQLEDFDEDDVGFLASDSAAQDDVCMLQSISSQKQQNLQSSSTGGAVCNLIDPTACESQPIVCKPLLPNVDHSVVAENLAECSPVHYREYVFPKPARHSTSSADAVLNVDRRITEVTDGDDGNNNNDYLSSDDDSSSSPSIDGGKHLSHGTRPDVTSVGGRSNDDVNNDLSPLHDKNEHQNMEPDEEELLSACIGEETGSANLIDDVKSQVEVDSRVPALHDAEILKPPALGDVVQASENIAVPDETTNSTRASVATKSLPPTSAAVEQQDVAEYTIARPRTSNAWLSKKSNQASPPVLKDAAAILANTAVAASSNNNNVDIQNLHPGTSDNSSQVADDMFADTFSKYLLADAGDDGDVAEYDDDGDIAVDAELNVGSMMMENIRRAKKLPECTLDDDDDMLWGNKPSAFFSNDATDIWANDNETTVVAAAAPDADDGAAAAAPPSAVVASVQAANQLPQLQRLVNAAKDAAASSTASHAAAASTKQQQSRFYRPHTTPGKHYHEAEHTANYIRSLASSADDAEEKTSSINNDDVVVKDVQSQPIREFSELAAPNDTAIQNLLDTIDDFFALGDDIKRARPQNFQRLALPTLMHPTRPNVLLVQRNAAGKTFAFILAMCLRTAQLKLKLQRQSRQLLQSTSTPATYYSRKPIVQIQQQPTAVSMMPSVSSNALCDRCKAVVNESKRMQSQPPASSNTDADELEAKSSHLTCPPFEPRVVVVCPTKELVDQIWMDARRLTRQWTPSINLAKTYGKQSYGYLQQQIANLHGAIDILICTLGRVQDDPNLANVCFSRCVMFICDDIDHFTGSLRSTKEYAEFLMRIENDRARRAENAVTVAAVENNNYDTKLQVILASAVYTPECVEKARMQMGNVGVVIGAREMPLPVVPHRVHVAGNAFDRKRVIAEIVFQIFSENRNAKVLIFVNERKYLNDVRHMLINNSSEHPLAELIIPDGNSSTNAGREELYDYIETLHGSLESKDRSSVYEKFTNAEKSKTKAAAADAAATNAAEIKILITTDVVCRGLDMSNISHVVNFNLPQKQILELFVNRIGRCGRLGNVAMAHSIFQMNCRKDEIALLKLMPLMRASLPPGEHMPREIEEAFAHANSHLRSGGAASCGDSSGGGGALTAGEGDVEVDATAVAANRWRVERELAEFNNICDDPNYVAKQVLSSMGYWM